MEILFKVETVNNNNGGLFSHSIIEREKMNDDMYSKKQMVLDIMKIDRRARILFKTLTNTHGIIDIRPNSNVDKFLDTYDSPGYAEYELLIEEINNPKIYEPLL